MAQADAILSTIPPAIKTTSAIYLPEIHSKSGNYFPEMARSDARRFSVVHAIAAGDYEDVIRVLAFDTEHTQSWDASVEVARDVLNYALDTYEQIPSNCRDFLETHLGVNTVRRIEREAA